MLQNPLKYLHINECVNEYESLCNQNEVYAAIYTVFQLLIIHSATVLMHTDKILSN